MVDRTNGTRIAMPSSARAVKCGIAEARSRLRTASAYLEVAALVLNERLVERATEEAER